MHSCICLSSTCLLHPLPLFPRSASDKDHFQYQPTPKRQATAVNGIRPGGGAAAGVGGGSLTPVGSSAQHNASASGLAAARATGVCMHVCVCVIYRTTYTNIPIQSSQQHMQAKGCYMPAFSRSKTCCPSCLPLVSLILGGGMTATPTAQHGAG
jgi:hypothetical protein